MNLNIYVNVNFLLTALHWAADFSQFYSTWVVSQWFSRRDLKPVAFLVSYSAKIIIMLASSDFFYSALNFSQLSQHSPWSVYYN